MTSKRIFLDVHAIHSLPPSNINRDDTGSPKTAQYGGVTRARVSSQSWKKAMRDYFHENSGASNVGIRSLEIVKYLATKIENLDSDISEEEAMNLADSTLNKAGIKTKDKRARALFFIGERQAEDLAQAAVDGVEDKKELQALLRDNPAVDIALFGRMVADDPSLNEDASSQVAHAISTHAVQTEFDFFTAVDDLAPEDNAGAGMLGTIEFNSSTLYRYANVAVHELLRQLDDREATINTLRLFIEAFAISLPTGKVNTFANQTLPQAILVNLRTDRPVNLVTAFEDPIKSTTGYIDKSINRLLDENDRVSKMIGGPQASYFISFTSNQVENPDIRVEEDFDSLLNDFSNDLANVLVG